MVEVGKLRPGAEVYSGLVKQAKHFIEDTAKSVPEKNWPLLPSLKNDWHDGTERHILDANGKPARGIELSPTGTAYYHRILHPDGSVGFYVHNTWKREGAMEDGQYLHGGFMEEVYKKVSVLQASLAQKEPQSKVRTLFRRPQKALYL